MSIGYTGSPDVLLVKLIYKQQSINILLRSKLSLAYCFPYFKCKVGEGFIVTVYFDVEIFNQMYSRLVTCAICTPEACYRSYYLEYGCHLARLHHRCCLRRVYASTSNTAITMRKSLHGFPLIPYMVMVLRLAALCLSSTISC